MCNYAPGCPFKERVVPSTPVNFILIMPNEVAPPGE